MSALSQKQTLRGLNGMSALPPKADIGTPSRNVRFVPEADISCGRRVQTDNVLSRAPCRYVQESFLSQFKRRHAVYSLQGNRPDRTGVHPRGLKHWCKSMRGGERQG